MKAYHIQTFEPDIYDATGLGGAYLDFIFAPEQNVLVGFLKGDGTRGRIVNYSSQRYCRNAQAIVSDEGQVKGTVIGEVDLPDETVRKISANDSSTEITAKLNFDGSTNNLVGILCGKLVKKQGLFRNYWRLLTGRV